MPNSNSSSRCSMDKDSSNSRDTKSRRTYPVIRIGTSRTLRMVCLSSHTHPANSWHESTPCCTFTLHIYNSKLEKARGTNMYIAHCSNYLCPDTLACVHFPHHCPCPHPTFEEKFELGDGKAVCISKGGFKAGEAARKVELARKGLL